MLNLFLMTFFFFFFFIIGIICKALWKTAGFLIGLGFSIIGIILTIFFNLVFLPFTIAIIIGIIIGCFIKN